MLQIIIGVLIALLIAPVVFTILPVVLTIGAIILFLILAEWFAPKEEKEDKEKL